MSEKRTVKTEKSTLFFLINSMHGGGAEKVVANLTLALESKYNIYILLLDRQTPQDYKTGGKIIVLDDGINRGKVKKLIFYKKQIETLAKEHQPKVIISFLLNACLCNALAKTNAKKIISVRNFLKKQFNGKKLSFWEFCFKYFFKKGDWIVSVSKAMEEDLIKGYKLKAKKSKVIYNPYFLNDILIAKNEPIDEKFTDYYSGQVIVNIGSLHQQKGQMHLIRAFAELKEQKPDLKLLIIGKGGSSDRGIELQLKKLVEDLKVDQDVIFLGHQTNPHKYLKSASVFAFPSLYEGFPNALLEAMICGVPVIAADCETGPREILAPNTKFTQKTSIIEEAEYGILIPTVKQNVLDAKDPLNTEEKMWVNALEEILNNEEKRAYYQRKSKQRASDFSIEKIISEWEEIF